MLERPKKQTTAFVDPQFDHTPFDDPMVRAAMSGDRNAFAALFDQHYELIYRVAFQYTRNRSDAEDVAQETCVKLARHLSSYRFESKFTTWLYRLTLNTAKDLHRKACRKYERAMPDGFDGPGKQPTPERIALTREFIKTVEALPEKLKAAVLLVFRDGLSHRQAADALGCAETTVSWRIHEARKVLARQLNDEDMGSSHA